jgi:hypothetical protein
MFTEKTISPLLQADSGVLGAAGTKDKFPVSQAVVSGNAFVKAESSKWYVICFWTLYEKQGTVCWLRLNCDAQLCFFQYRRKFPIKNTKLVPRYNRF